MKNRSSYAIFITLQLINENKVFRKSIALLLFRNTFWKLTQTFIGIQSVALNLKVSFRNSFALRVPSSQSEWSTFAENVWLCFLKICL